MTVSAINTFRLRPGVPVADFEQFSAELDRPVCLAFDEVLGFDVYFSDDGVVVEEPVDRGAEGQREVERAEAYQLTSKLYPVVELAAIDPTATDRQGNPGGAR